MHLLRFSTSRRRYLSLFPTSFVVVLFLWILFSFSGFIKAYFLPRPTEVLESTAALFLDHGYVNDILASIYRVLFGFLFSAVIGVPLGIILGINKHAEAAIEPFIDFIRYMPVAGFIPLSILWLGIGNSQKIAIIFIGTFFQLVPMVMNTTSSTPREYIETARTMGANDLYILRRVVVPNALPGIYNSLRISIGIAWTYLVVAEIVAAASGIGHVIIEAQRYLKTANIFVGILTVGLLGLATDYSFKVLHRWFFPWDRNH